MMEKFNFEDSFNELDKEIKNIQKKIAIDSVVKVFYGISSKGYERLSFLTTIEPPKIDSTKMIQVVQGQEGENVYWTCFDLLDQEYRKLFYIFCDDLLNTIIECNSEFEAMLMIKNRFYNWKLMFKKLVDHMPDEKEMGLYGELYFLKNYMIDKYGVDKSVESWGGPDSYSKDFSIDKTWYELKTTGSNSNKVRISSLSQLSSDLDGYLCIIKLEKMTSAYNAPDSNVLDLFKEILSLIKSNDIQEQFVRKVVDYGFNPVEESKMNSYSLKDFSIYLVNDNFPRILEKDIKYQEIGNVAYELILKAIEKYKVEE